MMQRGRCPDCKRETAVRKDGRLRAHKRWSRPGPHGFIYDKDCGGSGKAPVPEERAPQPKGKEGP